MNGQQVMRTVGLMMRPYVSKIGAMIAPAVVKAVDASPLLQELKVQWLGGVSEGVAHVQQGGVIHNPPAGSEGVLLRTYQGVQFIVGAALRKARPTEAVSAGETMLWATNAIGLQDICWLKLQADGSITVYTQNTFGKMTVKGDLEAWRGVKANANDGTFVTLTGLHIPSPFGPLGPPIPGN